MTANVEAAAASAADEQEQVQARDLGEVRHHDHVGDMIAQPPIQPAHGPIALVTQANVVPQSGSARFM